MLMSASQTTYLGDDGKIRVSKVNGWVDVLHDGQVKARTRQHGARTTSMLQ